MMNLLLPLLVLLLLRADPMAHQICLSAVPPAYL
jgi:hypothetical protein